MNHPNDLGVAKPPLGMVGEGCLNHPKISRCGLVTSRWSVSGGSATHFCQIGGGLTIYLPFRDASATLQLAKMDGSTTPSNFIFFNFHLDFNFLCIYNFHIFVNILFWVKHHNLIGSDMAFDGFH
jgi:hypothetical protein